MRKHKSINRWIFLLSLSFLAGGFSHTAWASEVDSEVTVRETVITEPYTDGSGKYMVKSDGFYCMNADGSLDAAPCVHYFDHFQIDGTEFNGYYYHDASGKYVAGSPRIVQISGLDVTGPDKSGEDKVFLFNGIYMANNLGRLTSAPQVRYMDNLVVESTTYNGYYYFDGNGRLHTDPGIHYISRMTSNGQEFEGNYYFGGENGVLLQTSGTVVEGFNVDATGKVEVEDTGMLGLETWLDENVPDFDGEWSVYVKDLNTSQTIVLNDTQMYAASLIKLFVMERTYAEMGEVLANEADRLNVSESSSLAQQELDSLLWDMITVSDNESYNELVRLQTSDYDFISGAEVMNEYLSGEGYNNTLVQHTLHPSSSESEGIADNNFTTAKNCGLLLERIYNGECVSEEASQEMLELLLNQETTTKIPYGITASDAVIANKTGETDSDQHDVAIVYGEKTDYILCIMTEDYDEYDAVMQEIREVSSMVYTYLNM
ncbi:MAG: class A beta-lactamase-related serine hydrolase [Clostridiales bacterium]|nr:class A beta-lactamase-related serine hydrolase [Clostridiales bacterium]